MLKCRCTCVNQMDYYSDITLIIFSTQFEQNCHNILFAYVVMMRVSATGLPLAFALPIRNVFESKISHLVDKFQFCQCS